MTSVITSALLIQNDEDDSKASQITKDEAVIFINPTKYSLEQSDSDDDGEDKSAFGRDIVEERDSNGDKLSEIKQKIIKGDLEMDEADIKPELVIGFRDPKQIKKMSKEQEQTPQKVSFFRKMFSGSSLTNVNRSTESNQNAMHDESDSSSSQSSEDNQDQNQDRN